MTRLQLLSTTFIVASLLNSGCTQNRTSEMKPSSQKRADFNKNSTTENNLTALKFQENGELNELLISAKENGGDSLDVDTGETFEEISYIPSEDDIDTGEIIEENSHYSSIDNNLIETNEALEDITNSPIEKNWVEISKEEEVILTAESFMGAKYVWAANGPECFDCSGFTRYVYREHGITLPRYSGHQAKVGIKIAYDELQIGDLVFFDTEKNYRRKVNHVGIYIGDNKFIHASSAKKRVVITSFKEKKFYKNRFLWGQRVLKDTTRYASL